jgi:hypothetical protein
MVNRNNKSQIFLGGMSNSDVSNQLFENVATWLKDGSTNDLQFNGTQQQIQTLKEAMLASKKFHNKLSNPDATLASVSESLKLKHDAAIKFQKLFGIEWPL